MRRMHATQHHHFRPGRIQSRRDLFVEVLVDDVMKVRYPVPVVLTPPPNPQTPQPPPEKKKV